MTYYNLTNITDSTDFYSLTAATFQHVPILGTLIFVAFSIILLAATMIRLEPFSAMLVTSFISVIIGIVLLSLGLISGYLLSAYIIFFLLLVFYHFT